MAWVDRTTHMERLWALEGAQSRLFIDEVRLREGFEKAGGSIRARGWWDVYLTEFELEMREELEKGLWLTANWHQVRDDWRAGALADGIPAARRSRACRTSWRGCSRKRRTRAPRKAPTRSRKIGVTSMKRLGRFLKAALKVTLGFFRLAVPCRVQVGDVRTKVPGSRVAPWLARRRSCRAPTARTPL